MWRKNARWLGLRFWDGAWRHRALCDGVEKLARLSHRSLVCPASPDARHPARGGIGDPTAPRRPAGPEAASYRPRNPSSSHWPDADSFARRRHEPPQRCCQGCQSGGRAARCH
eukprot:6253640-Prymnesium_polylepis.2